MIRNLEYNWVSGRRSRDKDMNDMFRGNREGRETGDQMEGGSA